MSQISCPKLPPDTAQAAKSVFGRDHAYIRAGEALSALWDELDLSAMQSGGTFMAGSFYPLALATILQYWEHLTDHQMAEASRTRLDLKYAMHLSLEHPGFEPCLLCRFRQQLLGDEGARDAVQRFMDRLAPFASREEHGADISRIITSICLPSRAEVVLGCMRDALEAVAMSSPDWLKAHTRAHWYRRYPCQLDDQEIPRQPERIQALMEAVAADGWHLLEAVDRSGETSLQGLPEIASLGREWQHQFEWSVGVPRLRTCCAGACESNYLFFQSGRLERKEGIIGVHE